MMYRVENAQNLPKEEEILQKPDNVCPVQWAVAVCKQAHQDCCGRGVFCRDGLKELYLIAEEITNNRGSMDDIELLQSLTQQVMLGADCDAAYEGARLMKLSIDTYYDDWTAHVLRKRCKSGQCTAFPKATIPGLDLGGTSAPARRRRPAAAPAEEPAAPVTRRRRKSGVVVVEDDKPAAVTSAPTFNLPAQEEEAAPVVRPAAPVVDLPQGGRRRRREKKVEILED